MKTLKLFTLSLLIAGLMISCNQSNKNNNSSTSGDHNQISASDRAKYDDFIKKAKKEINESWIKLNKLDENETDFNIKLNRELDELDSKMDNLADELNDKGQDLKNNANKLFYKVRVKSKGLKDKLKRWSSKTGDNLDNLGNDIKKEFRELKESVKEI